VGPAAGLIPLVHSSLSKEIERAGLSLYEEGFRADCPAMQPGSAPEDEAGKQPASH